MSWNYRIGVKKYVYPEHIRISDEPIFLFSVIEVYYDENKVPNGYAEYGLLENWDSFKDLKMTHKLIKRAFKKPVLDLDNFPQIWSQK